MFAVMNAAASLRARQKKKGGKVTRSVGFIYWWTLHGDAFFFGTVHVDAILGRKFWGKK